MIVSESAAQNYRTEIGNGSAVISSDVTEVKGGQGQFFRPHDLLCAALASCLNISTRMVLDSRGLRYDKVTVKVDLDRTAPTETKFLYDIEIAGEIPEDVKRHVIAVASRCPVKKTLSKELVFEERQGL